MIDEGTYLAEVTYADLGETSTGKEQIAIGFTTDSGESVTYYGYFTDKSVDYTFEAMRAAGWTGNDVTDLDMMLGTKCSIVVEHEDYEGKTKARVRWVNTPGGGRLKKKMDEGKKASFAERMKARATAFAQKEQTDDIPF